MPISARWRKLENLPPKKGRDALPGVYELADEAKTIIYIGQSKTDVPNRIRQHLQKNTCIAERIVYWRHEYSRVPQADEAKLLTDYRSTHEDAMPPCNKAMPKERDAKRRYSELSNS